MIPEAISNDLLLIKRCIHTAFLAACPRAMYSVSVVEVNTVRCLLLLYKTIAPFKRKQFSITEFRFSGLPAKLLSAYPISPYVGGAVSDVPSDFLPYTRPNCIVPSKYQTTLSAAWG